MSLETAAIDLDGYDRAANRRAELAAAALTTLAQRGYARTSLREIALNSSYSHGIFHYYFESKDDLILECVRIYKESCVAGYDDLIDAARTPDQLRASFSKRVSDSLTQGLDMHRLWYDLRAQTLFIDTFRTEVREIDDLLAETTWRIVTAYAGLLGSETRSDPATTYATVDGIFERAVRDATEGMPDTAEQLVHQLDQLLQLLVPGRPLS